MMTFSDQVLKMLAEYKRVLKRHLAPAERDAKITQLGLWRQDLRAFDEVALYQKAREIIADTRCWLVVTSTSPTAYSGIDEFCQHLAEYLDQFHIDHAKVVHTKQLVSRAVVEAIQILALPADKQNVHTENKLKRCAEIIARYGDKEQQADIEHMLRKHEHPFINFFVPLVNSVKEYIHQSQSGFVAEEQFC